MSKLYFRYGAMNCGKTTQLLQVAHNYEEKNKKVIIIKASIVSKLKHIPVICYGLKTDFKTNSFEGSKRLFELSDELEELITICSCGKRAKFNSRKCDGKYLTDGKQVLIDGTSNIEYESLCGKCYIQKVLGK